MIVTHSHSPKKKVHLDFSESVLRTHPFTPSTSKHYNWHPSCNPLTRSLISAVRPLTETETKTLFSKLANYLGSNLVHLVDTPEDPHVFRLHRSRVYYVREQMIRQAVSVPRVNLISLGVCLGKFSKTEKFRLHVTALDLMGRYAKHKVSPLSLSFSQSSFSCLLALSLSSSTGLD